MISTLKKWKVSFTQAVMWFGQSWECCSVIIFNIKYRWETLLLEWLSMVITRFWYSYKMKCLTTTDESNSQLKMSTSPCTIHTFKDVLVEKTSVKESYIEPWRDSHKTTSWRINKDLTFIYLFITEQAGLYFPPGVFSALIIQWLDHVSPCPMSQCMLSLTLPACYLLLERWELTSR